MVNEGVIKIEHLAVGEILRLSAFLLGLTLLKISCTVMMWIKFV